MIRLVLGTDSDSADEDVAARPGPRLAAWQPAPVNQAAARLPAGRGCPGVLWASSRPGAFLWPGHALLVRPWRVEGGVAKFVICASRSRLRRLRAAGGPPCSRRGSALLLLAMWPPGNQPLEIKTPGGPGTAWLAALIALRWSQPLAVCFQPAAAACVHAWACCMGLVVPLGPDALCPAAFVGVLLQLTGRVSGGWELRGSPGDGFACRLLAVGGLCVWCFGAAARGHGVPRLSTVLCSSRGVCDFGCYQGPDIGIPQTTPCGVMLID